jgi:thiaminase/transcriptional activator TenA
MPTDDQSFPAQLIDEYDDLWNGMLDHPFLLEMRDGDIDEETFNTWLRQDYVFVEAAIPFVGQLISKCPSPQLRSALADIPPALEEELDLFEERADALGVDVSNVEPGLTNHAYVQFLEASAYRESFPAAFTVYWAAEKAYHESWKVASPGIGEDHKWRPFVDNWAGEEFGQLVSFLEGEVSELGAQASDQQKQRMRRMFELTVKYETAFWEMAHCGPNWPGV